MLWVLAGWDVTMVLLRPSCNVAIDNRRVASDRKISTWDLFQFFLGSKQKNNVSNYETVSKQY